MNSLMKKSPKLLLITKRCIRLISSIETMPPEKAPPPITKASVCPREMDIFNQLSKVWWDVDGPMSLLHKMNPCRLQILKEQLNNCGKINLHTANTKKPFAGLNILEVGCGGGFLSEALAQMGAQVTAVEAAQDAIQVAINHLQENPELGRNLNYVHGTIEDFSVTHRNQFDVLVASEVIEHVGDTQSFTKYSIECLRPGGSVFFTTMNRNWLSGLYYIFTCENVCFAIPKGTHEYKKFVKPEEVEGLFKTNKCAVIDVQGYTTNLFNYNWFKVPFKTFSFAVHGIKQ